MEPDLPTTTSSLNSADAMRRALELTRRMVGWGSCSRTAEEREFATRLHSLLSEFDEGLLERGLYPVPDDPWERCVSWAFLRGDGPRTVLLLSHFDTVGTEDYGMLQRYALEPDVLRERMRAIAPQFSPLTQAHLESDDWLVGRGTADMKSGIAAHLVVLERLVHHVRDGGRLPGNVMFLCTPDEECESAGILASVELLATMERERGIEFVGAINNDYFAPQYEGDDSKRVYTGTVGKLLAGLYVRGVETHAGEPYAGCDADLLLADATWLERDRPLPTGVHMTGFEAGRTAAEAGAKRLMVTHVYPSNDPADTAAEASTAYDGDILVAADLQEIVL